MMEAEVRKRKRERDGSQESDEPRDVGEKLSRSWKWQRTHTSLEPKEGTLSY